MIHLDTNVLIDLVTVGSPHVAGVERWLRAGGELAASAVAWSEFCNGPHSRDQKDHVFAVLAGGVLPFTLEQAEQASRLFHLTGRRRGSHADCMIAAAAISAGAPVATRNVRDFERFIPLGLALERIVAVPA